MTKLLNFARSADFLYFNHNFLQKFFNFGKSFLSLGIKTFPQIGQNSKLFPDAYLRIIGNIYPWAVRYKLFHFSLPERQEILKAQYHFSCDCTSCNRLDLMEFQERFSALRCHHCGGPIQNPSSEAALAHSMPCLDCGKIQVCTTW